MGEQCVRACICACVGCLGAYGLVRRDRYDVMMMEARWKLGLLVCAHGAQKLEVK